MGYTLKDAIHDFLRLTSVFLTCEWYFRLCWNSRLSHYSNAGSCLSFVDVLGYLEKTITI